MVTGGAPECNTVLISLSLMNGRARTANFFGRDAHYPERIVRLLEHVRVVHQRDAHVPERQVRVVREVLQQVVLCNEPVHMQTRMYENMDNVEGIN